MNIGIDFNIKNIKACFSNNQPNIEASQIIDVSNIFTFVKDGVFIGNDGLNKFLTEKEAKIYDLNQIVDLNGLIINKQQISIEKCVTLLFNDLLNKIKKRSGIEAIEMICVSIPYEKFYFWRELFSKVLSSFPRRIIQQPPAIIALQNSQYSETKLNIEPLKEAQEKRDRLFQKYNKKTWYKKLISKKPTGTLSLDSQSNVFNCLFLSITQNNSNIALFEYGEGVSEIYHTQYTNDVSEDQLYKLVFDYFMSEIKADKQGVSIEDPKTIWRIKKIADDFLKNPQENNFIEINLPYVLCEDGQYRTVSINVGLDRLYNSFDPSLNSLIRFVKTNIKEFRYKSAANRIVVVGDTLGHNYIRAFIEKGISGLSEMSKITFVSSRSLALGALDYSRTLTGDKKDLLSLEVVPFSVLVRLHSGDSIELIAKDTIIPKKSMEHTFEIRGDSKSKFIEVHLITKEGSSFQSLNAWKIEVGNLKIFEVQVEIDSNMIIALKAYSQNREKLSVQSGTTFSLKGAGLEVGIKGKDIREYILNQFNYLSATLRLDEITIFEPDEEFYSMMKQGDPFKALRYIGYFLKLKSLPDVEFKETHFFEEQGIAGFISGSKINIPVLLKDDPYGCGYVLAHELAHYILNYEEGIVLDDEQENEILTEIFVVYKGMGKLFLNGFNAKDTKKFTSHSRGYLDEKIIKYIHQIYFEKFNINASSYKNNLNKEGLKILG